MPISSYEYRIKPTASGTWGSPVDVGNVLTTIISALDRDTSYDIEVRAKDDLGVYSPWTPVTTGSTTTEYTEKASLTTGLVSHWHFNDLTDSVGSNNLTNGGIDVAGGRALFDGTNFLSHADNSSLSFDSGTSFEICIKNLRLASIGAIQGILCKTGGGGNEWSLYFNSTGAKLEWQLSSHILESSEGLAANTYYNLFIGYNSATDTRYLQVSDGTLETAGTPSAPVNDTNALQFGAFNGSFVIAAGSEMGDVRLWNRVLTPDERTSINNATLEPYTLLSADFAYNTHTDTTSHYKFHNALSGVRLQTRATEINVAGYCDITASPYGKLAVFVDGVWQETLQFSAIGDQAFSVTVPSGDKEVYISTGALSVYPSPPAVGTFLKVINANKPYTILTENRSTPHGMWVYGDSISVGDGDGASNNAPKNGWIPQLRGMRGTTYPIIAAGAGGLSLYDDSASGFAAIVAHAVIANPAEIYICIGTNDFGLNRQTSSAFQTQMGTFLTALHTALPSAHITLQTPLLRTDTTTNGLGETLPAYRTAATNAASGRAYVTVIDGTTVMTTGGLSADGLHPSTAGHLTIATYINTHV